MNWNLRPRQMIISRALSVVRSPRTKSISLPCTTASKRVLVRIMLELACMQIACTCVLYHLFTILIVTEDTSSSETDQLFADVKELIKEIRSDWYSLAKELDIDYATRNVRP